MTGVRLMTAAEKLECYLGLVRESLPNGEPCSHVGCSSHISHHCEGCGRIGAVNPLLNPLEDATKVAIVAREWLRECLDQLIQICRDGCGAENPLVSCSSCKTESLHTRIEEALNS